jgi:hypothetical protein
MVEKAFYGVARVLRTIFGLVLGGIVSLLWRQRR